MDELIEWCDVQARDNGKIRGMEDYAARFQAVAQALRQLKQVMEERDSLDPELMLEDFRALADKMGQKLDDYDSDDGMEECLNNILRDAGNALQKFGISYSKEHGEYLQSPEVGTYQDGLRRAADILHNLPRDDRHGEDVVGLDDATEAIHNEANNQQGEG